MGFSEKALQKYLKPKRNDEVEAIAGLQTLKDFGTSAAEFFSLRENRRSSQGLEQHQAQHGGRAGWS